MMRSNLAKWLEHVDACDCGHWAPEFAVRFSRPKGQEMCPTPMYRIACRCGLSGPERASVRDAVDEWNDIRCAEQGLVNG